MVQLLGFELQRQQEKLKSLKSITAAINSAKAAAAGRDRDFRREQLELRLELQVLQQQAKRHQEAAEQNARQLPLVHADVLRLQSALAKERDSFREHLLDQQNTITEFHERREP